MEFDDEVCVLDYKMGETEDASRYRSQMREYREAMQAVYAGMEIRTVLIYADGKIEELT